MCVYLCKSRFGTSTGVLLKQWTGVRSVEKIAVKVAVRHLGELSSFRL